MEEFNFADKKSSAHEIIRQQIREGASLSCLGKVTLDDEGKIRMSQLLAVIAGGLPEARNFLGL